MKGFILRNKLYSLLVLLPMVFISIYYGLIMTKRYVSEAQMIIQRDSASSSVAAINLSGLMGMSGAASLTDAPLVKEFILSPTMLDYLDQTLQLKQHYATAEADSLSRLSADATREDFLKYYRKRVSVRIDSESQTVKLEFQAFDPPYAKKLADAAVARAEQFVNGIGQSLAREQIRFVQGELEQANERLQKVSQDLLKMQNENRLLSPEIESQSVSQIIAGLQQQLAAERASLKNFLSFLGPGASEVVAARKRISAMERQVEQERAKQVGDNTGSDQGLNDLLLKYKEMELNVQVASDIYQTGLASLESAKLDASRKVKHIVMVSAPGLPERARYPRKAYTIVSAFILLNIAYFLISLVVATIRDHRE